MTERFSLNVNGQEHTVDADPDMPLLYALRNDLGLNNPKFGCGLAQCGACTVHLTAPPSAPASLRCPAVGKAKVVTLAGLGTPDKPHPLQTAYVAGASASMRLLHQRLDHDRCGVPQREQEAE